MAAMLALTGPLAFAQLSLEQALLSRTDALPSSANAAAGQSLSRPQPQLPAQLTPDGSTATEQALHALADQADVIFAGEVVAIHHDPGAVRVDWRVIDGVRGVQTGGNFTLREWAGLWTGDGDRYRLGQRALLLLHAESAAGFRSPVGGTDGILPLNGDLLGGTADLRWIATRRLRPELPAIFPDRDVAGPLGLRAEASASTLAPAATEPDLHAIDAGLVAQLLRAWSTRSAQ